MVVEEQELEKIAQTVAEIIDMANRVVVSLDDKPNHS